MSYTRDAYVQKMKAELDKWNDEISKLGAEAKQNQAMAGEQIKNQIEVLKKKRQVAEANLEKLRQAGDDTWEDLKLGFENALNSLGDAMRNAYARFK